MKTLASILLAALALLAGCGRPPATEAPKAPAPTTPTTRPQVRGVIRGVLPARDSLVVEHEEIPGVMRAMTMAFRVDAETLQTAREGQPITGELEQSGMTFTLLNVKLGPAPAGTATPTPAAAMPAAAPVVVPASLPASTPAAPATPPPPAATTVPAALPNPPAVPAAPEITPALLAGGASVYNRICITCHQPTGQGIFPLFPPLAGSPIVTGDAARLARIVLHGLQGPVEVNGRIYNSLMPGLSGQFTDEEIAAVLTYVRNTWGNAAPAVAPTAVAAERAANRTTPWTWVELTAP